MEQKQPMRNEASGAARKSGLQITVTIIAALLCVIFGLLLIFNLFIIAQGLIHPDVPPSVFGVTPMVVKSGSMSSDITHYVSRDDLLETMTAEQIDKLKIGDEVETKSGSYTEKNLITAVTKDSESGEVISLLTERPAEDHIEVGDLIIVKKVDLDDLKVGSVITFLENKIAVTHRIIDISRDEKGEYLFKTKGDANNSADKNDGVRENAIVGIFVTRIPKLGDFIYFLQRPLGMIIFIGVPCLTFIIYDIIRRTNNAKKEQSKTEELEKELERLRALAKEKNEKEPLQNAEAAKEAIEQTFEGPKDGE